jgi:DNA-binding CsgD family transcriptional regulator
MRARLTSSHLVGRIGELAELELAYREAASGRSVLVLVRGESGIGKTRLLSELERRLGEQPEPPLVLRGEAVEHGGTELPYAPLLGALRERARARDPAFDALTPASRSQLATLLPAIAPAAAATPAPGDGSGQLRLFEALLELLQALADRRTLVLCLEDLHWADRSTRTFVAFLARSLPRAQIMLVLSYRSDELHRRHPLRPLIAELERIERTRRVELAPLDRAELFEALSDILGRPPEQELLERLQARSEGNPLYLEELLAAGLDGRGAAPESLRDAFLLRIERLSPSARAACRAIAVGQALGERILAQLVTTPRESLAEALREALSEQVLVAGADGRLRFRHELLRETLYEDLLPGERSDLHLALARALESGVGDGEEGELERAARIARHYAAAGEQPAALRASVRAALAARAARAHGEAGEMAERALELWPRVGEAERGLELDHVDLLALAADAHGIVGDHARREVLLRAALEQLGEGDPRRRAMLMDQLARALWSLNRGPEGIELAQQALGLLPDLPPNRERALLLAWLARTLALRGKLREATQAGQRALQAAAAVGDTLAEGEVLNTLGMVRMALGEEEAGVGDLRRAAELARARGDHESLATAQANLADLLLLRGRTREALDVGTAALRELPHGFHRSREWLELTVSEVALEAGETASARAHLKEASGAWVGVIRIFRLLRAADLALVEADEEGAARALAEAEPHVARSTEPQWIGLLGSTLGELHRRRGELAQGRAAVEHALGRLELCTDDVMRIARLSAIGARLEADFAQRGRDLREPAMARDALVRARLHLQRVRAAAQEGGPVERAWSLTGAAELGRARGRAEPQRWLAAAEAWEAIARPYQATYARWRAAEAHLERGARAEAAAQASVAALKARRIGAVWLAGEVSALIDRARLAPAVAAGEEDHERADAAASGRDGGGRTGASGDGSDPFGLTARERQVLALLAEGATNRQIGAALYMAEKTASVHVSRILAKLGVQTRTQAAAVAHRMHLAR